MSLTSPTSLSVCPRGFCSNTITLLSHLMDRLKHGISQCVYTWQVFTWQRHVYVQHDTTWDFFPFVFTKKVKVCDDTLLCTTGQLIHNSGLAHLWKCGSFTLHRGSKHLHQSTKFLKWSTRYSKTFFQTFSMSFVFQSMRLHTQPSWRGVSPLTWSLKNTHHSLLVCFSFDLTSHYPRQRLWFTVHCDRLATSGADVSEDPQVEAARKENSQTKQRQADERARAHAEKHDDGGVAGLTAGFLGWKSGQHESKKMF